nr:carboxypeptidase s1 like a [Quercus suber]
MKTLALFSLPPSLATVVVAFILLPVTTASYPPPASYQNVLTSPLDPRITISYKQPDDGTCETAFTTQKQYTGYISIPPHTLAPIRQRSPINTFFWFVEARQTPEIAPLTIWLNGGPGSSSMVGFFNELGPCQVVQVQDGSYGTQKSMWGWDRSSNMLFIDQPSLVGFSFDLATNASYDVLAQEVYEPPTPPSPGLPSYMYLNGTFGSASADDAVPYASTANTTDIAAQATWHFLQSWLAAFPQYNPSVRPNVTTNAANMTVGVNLFTESYGGKFGPVFASYFLEQNERRLNGSMSSNGTLSIKLDTVGIMSGQIDDLIQDYYYPYFAYNNTYGIQAITATDQLNALQEYSGSGRCRDQIQQCRKAMNSTDPDGFGDVAATNELCVQAQYTCTNLTAAYLGAGFNPYDIREKLPSPHPPAAYVEYLNQARVLEAIGAKVNYTESSRYVQQGFIATGDTIRGGQIEDIAYLLRQGIRVALVYGDADFICNWYGGQAASLAIAAALPDFPSNAAMDPVGAVANASYADGFPNAGYAEIVVNSSYVGGCVRQYGNLSFSRIYDAGHLIPYYQPEAAFTVFARIIQGDDIATGDTIDPVNFGSVGPQNSTHTNAALPSSSTPTCWVRAWNATCSSADLDAMLAGSGTVANGIYFRDDDVQLPTSTIDVSFPDQPLSTISSDTALSDGTSSPTQPLTGVYTASGTPSPSSRATVIRPLTKWETRTTFTMILLGLFMGAVLIML